MKRYLFILLGVVVALGSFSATASAQSADSGLQLSDVSYRQRDSARVVQLLSMPMAEGENDVLFFARRFIGVPYVAHTLEIADPERLVVNLRELDCTTYVETVLALAMTHRAGSKDFMDYCHNLERIRYRGGRLNGYLSRLHYFAWWMHDNVKAGILEEVTDATHFTAPMRVNDHYMTKHADSYKMLRLHPEWVKEITKMEKAENGADGTYLPKGKTKLGARQLPVQDGDVIAIVTKKDGLDYSHLGIAVWGTDGFLHLLNASSLYHRVVEDDNSFYSYLKKQSSALGARFLRLK